MSLEFCVLGSGSSGNSTVVRAAGGVKGGAFLIDAGFGPRVTEQRLYAAGMQVKDIAAIVLTHLDSDHFNPYWLLTIVKQGIRVHVSRNHLKAFLKLGDVRDIQRRMADPVANPKLCRELAVRNLEELVRPFDGSFEPIPGVQLAPIDLAHDTTGSHGFVLECSGYRAGFATDLGRVPETLIEHFRGVDLLAIESNYDPDMQLASDRPWHLKQRIMGGSGHLSNEQALAAVQRILDRTAEHMGPDRLPRHIVLLHRSRQCNCPKLVRRLFSADARIAPVLTLTDQFEPTPWLYANRPRAQRVEQLALAW
jgi:phosphoribosyl 1,2-cyclic phosphodiesterase